MKRKQNFQPIAWFWDLHQRELLDLDPPYQRRSVWNQSFKDYFIDTILLEYPAPAIFLYEDISPEGRAKYYVVDGKQRLTSIFEFVNDLFPVADTAQRSEFRGLYFSGLEDDVKRDFWGFQFSVEYLPTVEESVISNVFDRINRNMKRLSAQELRHAKFDGEFIKEAERWADWMNTSFPSGFPNIASSSRRQMKDVEFVADLLLMMEVGPKGYSTDALDSAFSERDADWEAKNQVVADFEATTQLLLRLISTPEGDGLKGARLRNQADFYSLFGALAALRHSLTTADASDIAARLAQFANAVDQPARRVSGSPFHEYYEAARSASNLTAQRKTRVDVLKMVLTGEIAGL